MTMMTMHEVRQKYPDYNDLSDHELADKLHDAHYSDMPKEDFYQKIGLQPEQSKQEQPKSKADLISSFLPKPELPLGFDVGAGLLSLAGKNKGEKDVIRNLPHIALGDQAGLPQKFAQGVGEMAPMAASGVGEVPGILGVGARIASNAAYGAATSPGERLSGAGVGAGLGTAGELIPGATSAAKMYAEKIRPIKYVKNKISEMMDIYQEAKTAQKEAYKKATDSQGKQLITQDPQAFLGFDKSHLSLKAEKAYDDFAKEPTVQNLHKMQSEFFKDANLSSRYKNATDDAGIRIKDKAQINRPALIGKIKQVLGNDKEALSNYEKGTQLTRDIIKPFEATPTLRRIVNGKIKQMAPNKFGNAIQKALEGDTEFPANHYLRQVHKDTQNKLEVGRLLKSTIPYMVRKWTPQFTKVVQSPLVEALVQGAKIPYGILRAGQPAKQMSNEIA